MNRHLQISTLPTPSLGKMYAGLNRTIRPLTSYLPAHENHVWAGIREARKMMTEIEKFKGANQEDWLKHAPANWGYYLNAGPSEDFVIGMLYEQVRGVVERQILQEEDGRYISNIALYQENARASYDENGCKDLK